MKRTLVILCIALTFFQCKKDKGTEQTAASEAIAQIPMLYAKGFEVTDYGDYKVLKINDPWPKAETAYRYALVPKDKAATLTLDAHGFDAIVMTPIEKIVVTSTTHIPALEMLGVERTLVGFPGTEYVSSEKTRQRIDDGSIRELGKNEGINTEVLLETSPDLVVGFGIDGNNKTFNTIQKSGIPVMYNGDWVETSPLAKAEWIKFFGLLYDKEAQADSIFDHIASEYSKAKKIAANIAHRPTVLSGAMHKDIWYLPSGTSPEAQLLKDANANYLWSDTTEKGSLALNFETVFDKAKDADIWISPSYYPSLEAIEKANGHYTKFKAFQSHNVYSFVNKTGATGGVLYFELGTARPDLVLKDLITICHPELLTDYDPFFFKKLD